MAKITTVEEGVKAFFAYHKKEVPEYSVTEGKKYKTLTANGKTVPLFIYEEHPKIRGIMAKREILGSPCALTVYSVDCTTLDELLFRELSVAEKCFKSQVKSVMSYVNGNSLTALVKMENDGTAYFTLNAADFGEKHFKHEYFTTEGMICNRAVDTVVEQHAMNIYTKEGGYEYITDNHHVLYGLMPDEVNEVICIYGALTQSTDGLTEKAERLAKLADVVIANSGKTVVKGVDF